MSYSTVRTQDYFGPNLYICANYGEVIISAIPIYEGAITHKWIVSFGTPSIA